MRTRSTNFPTDVGNDRARDEHARRIDAQNTQVVIDLSVWLERQVVTTRDDRRLSTGVVNDRRARHAVVIDGDRAVDIFRRSGGDERRAWAFGRTWMDCT